MTSSLPITAPLGILQADHAGKVTSEERVSQSAHNGEWCRIQLPALSIHWDSSPFSLLKTVMAEQNLWSWSRDMSLPSPQNAGFSE